MKQLITWLAIASFCLPALADQPHAVVLLYHHVANNTPKITSVTPEQFEQQLNYLAQQQFVVMSLPDIARRIATGKTLPDKTVGISFDDAYPSVYDQAFPRLKQRGWPFTIFVNTDAVDKGHGIQSSWEQLREMAASGATIANHSVSHAHLPRRLNNETQADWQQRVSAEINQAQERIESEIGDSKKLFAYPYGEFDLALQLLLKEKGYTAFGQQSGAWGTSTDSQAIPRFAFAGRYSDIEEFALKVSTRPFPLSSAKAPDNPLPHTNSLPMLKLEFETGNYQGLNCFGTGQGALALKWLSKTIVEVTPNKPIPVGRSRINCTMAAGNGRFYWYSHQWIRLDANEQWILD